MRMRNWVAALAAIGTMSTLGAAVANAQTAAAAVPPVPKFDKRDPKVYGKALAVYAEAYDSGWVDSYSKAEMTLTDARGDEVKREVRQMLLEGTDGDKGLVRFMSPADIRGVAALTHEHPKGTDDSWLYLPASRRVRRISGANRRSSFQGTEFTYEDLSGYSVERYDWKFLAEETLDVDGKAEKVFKLEAKPRYKDTGYSRLVMYLNQKHWRGEKIEFYDLAGKHLKTLTASKWHQYHGRYWRPELNTMINHQTHKKTTIVSKSFFLNLSLYKRKDGSPRDNLKDEQFTKRALEDG